MVSIIKQMKCLVKLIYREMKWNKRKNISLNSEAERVDLIVSRHESIHTRSSNTSSPMEQIITHRPSFVFIVVDEKILPSLLFASHSCSFLDSSSSFYFNSDVVARLFFSPLLSGSKNPKAILIVVELEIWNFFSFFLSSLPKRNSNFTRLPSLKRRSDALAILIHDE